MMKVAENPMKVPGLVNVYITMDRSTVFMGKFTINGKMSMIIELDDGNFLTGKPNQFDGKNTHGFPVKIFPTKPIQ